VLFSFMSYSHVCNNSNTTGATCGAGTDYSFGASSVFSVLCCVLYIIGLHIVLFNMLFVLLRYMASDYTFGIFKLVLHVIIGAPISHDSNKTNDIFAFYFISCKWFHFLYLRDCRGRVRMIVGFTTTCAISAYHH